MGGHNPNLGKDIGLGVATGGIYPAMHSMYEHNKGHMGGEAAMFGLGPTALLLPKNQQQQPQQPMGMNAQNLAMLQQIQNPNQNFNGITF